ncbi:MAG: hypothetical protein HYT79_00160 [Elusimicrobia bacterium]|nr:hypothetical protein [Elusimicrobiota bacterium]
MNKRSILRISLMLSMIMVSAVLGRAQQSNFQIAPAPIAYPYFEPRRTDIKLTGVYFGIKATDISIKGGGINGNFRRSMNETAAFDAQLGLFGLGGELPGFALPFVYSNALWTPVIDGKASLSGVSFPLSFNLEIQALNRPGGSLLFFAGPNMALALLSMVTPYHAQSGVTNAAKTNFTAEMTTFLGGVQGGAQGSVRMGQVKVVPFFMTMTQSGSASFSFKHGYSGVRSLVTSSVVDIEPFTVNSFGADIIIIPWNLSIGTLIQQMSAEKDQQGVKTTIFQLSWHFRGS